MCILLLAMAFRHMADRFPPFLKLRGAGAK
jgi:hypothetical protein